MSIQENLKKRILIIDGAMGTMIQRHKLTEADYRGTRFANWPSDVKGNNDLLCITQPAIVTGIHLQYLEACFKCIEAPFSKGFIQFLLNRSLFGYNTIVY